MTILTLCSQNEHKLTELKDLLHLDTFDLVIPKDKLEINENGESFAQNALLKAKAYYHLTKSACLSDDSGLCVKSLPNELGVRSARFGGEGLNDKDRSLLLLKKLKDQKSFTANSRAAFFVCVLCFYLNPAEIFYFEGRLDGVISDNYQGVQGFGYDPVFIPSRISSTDSRTLSQLIEWKRNNSHRAKACKQASDFFKNFKSY